MTLEINTNRAIDSLLNNLSSVAVSNWMLVFSADIQN